MAKCVNYSVGKHPSKVQYSTSLSASALFIEHVEEAVGGRPVGLEQLDDERVLDVLRDGRLAPQI